MSAKANYFKIGIFVISAAIITIIAIVFLGAGAIFKKKLIVETFIDGSVQGLDVGSPLKLRGVKLGNVEKITFVSEEYDFDRNSKEYFTYGHYICVKSAIEPSEEMTEKEKRLFIEKMIKNGLRIRLASQGITGMAYLEADFLDTKEYPPMKITWEPHDFYVPSVPSTITEFKESIDQILSKLEEINVQGITNSLEHILVSVNKVLDDARTANLTKQTGNLLAELRETNKRLGPLLSDASATMATIRRITGDTEKPMTQSLTALGELPDIITQLKSTLRQFRYFVSGEEQNVAVSTENVRLITENLRDLTENAKRYPSQSLFGNPPPHSQPGDKQ